MLLHWPTLRKKYPNTDKGEYHEKRYTTLVLASAALVLLTGSFASAATINLMGTIRDFNASHPNFEGAIDGHQPGIVESTLGGDNKPVLSNPKPAGATSITNAADFNQWYNDVLGVNMSAAYGITLDNGGSGNVYTYSNSSFFPIDGQLFGNEGRAHNYHFTYEIHSAFTYQGGESFTFTGDDDLWVFIDNKLAVDLGGVHGAITGSVELDTFALANGFTIGNNYKFDLFFAERHTTQSNFQIDTSIELQQPVPEPTTMLLFGTGLAGLAGLRARRKK